MNNTASCQINVFCGYCRDNGGGSSAATGCFEADPNPACPVNSGCIAAGDPFLCCSGVGMGTCDQSGPKSCASNADCTDGSGTWPDCMQRTQGAFGPTWTSCRKWLCRDESTTKRQASSPSWPCSSLRFALGRRSAALYAVAFVTFVLAVL